MEEILLGGACDVPCISRFGVSFCVRFEMGCAGNFWFECDLRWLALAISGFFFSVSDDSFKPCRAEVTHTTIKCRQPSKAMKYNFSSAPSEK